MFNLTEIHPGVRQCVVNSISENWGSKIIVTKGKLHNTEELPGYLVMDDQTVLGIITYQITDRECEIVSLDSFLENRGIGSLLIDSVINAAGENRCHKIFLITTNDNTHAIRFYQKRGFELTAIHRNAIMESRKLKPQIPLIGFDGIPILHELEFERIINE